MGNCKSSTAIISAKIVNTEVSVTSHSSCQYEDADDPVTVIRNNMVGGSQKVITPFGFRKIVYADYTASGRYLQAIEEFLSSSVYPFYANTHTEASSTGATTTHLREEARSIVSKSLNAPQNEYTVLFVGTGCTGAIEKMMKVLGIYLPDFVAKKWNLSMSELIQVEERPVVFIGPFEHHSNELPWRDSIATVVVIPEDEDGCPDMNILQSKLIQYKNRRLKIGSFCAGSNVTGICIDTKAYARLLHKVGKHC
jgi:selenocysteine lyase/cysteine desulfurase